MLVLPILASWAYFILFQLYWKSHNIKFTILTFLKCTVECEVFHIVVKRICYETDLQKFLLLQVWNYTH